MLLTILAFILILGFLVLVHELGHFLVARKLGVAVEEFGLGFPPKIAGWRRRGTRYSLNAIPLGGFVKIKGEEGEESRAPDSFSTRPVGQRLLIVIAGVVMNVLAGWLLLVILFATAAPMEIGSHIPPVYVREQGIVITEVMAESPAQRAALAPGDKIVAIDNQPMSNVAELQSYIAGRKDQEISLQYERSGRLFAITLVPKVLTAVAEGRAVLGVGLAEIGLVRFPLGRAVVAASQAAVGYLARIGAAFGELVRGLGQGRGLGENLGGPVAIAVATNEVVGLGWPHALLFTAILSLNLAVINILPLPALDGGRIVFLLAEKIRGRAVRPVIEAWFHRLGFVLLLILAAAVTYHDLLRFGGRIWQAVIG